MEHILVKSLLEKLLKLSREDANLIAGAETEFRLLRERVELVNACLIEVAEMRRTHQLREDLSKRIITAVYRSEDGIDNFLLHQLQNKWPKFIDSDRGKRIIENLSVEIDGLLDMMMANSSRSLPSSQKHILISNTLCQVMPTKVLERWMIEIKQSNPVNYVPTPLEGPESEDDEVIGFDEEAEVVIKRLLGGSGDYRDLIVPIVGMVGQGKSTLARKIYHDTRISHEFFSCSWITVGHLGNKVKDICLSFLKGLITPRHWEQYEHMSEYKLQEIILGILDEGDRRLIVLDDVRTHDVVDFFRRIFGENGKGHRILMTTRHVAISQYANSHPHYLKFLTPDNSFELLNMKVFGRRSCPDHELIELGKNIAMKCSRIPILVVIIAGVLRGWRSKIEWQILEKNMVRPEKNYDDSTTMYKFLNLSYYHLTEEMKLCFLYFSIFPRGFDIPAWKLIRLWIAECLIEYNPSSSIEERAEKCLKSLVDRNLVMVIQKTSCGHIKTCRIHDLLHEFCKEEAKRWSFQEISQDIGSSTIPETTRQLCVQSSVLNDFLSTKPSGEHLRSFYCFTSRQSQMNLFLSDIRHITKAFPLLRVLDFECGHSFFSKEFFQLFLLRYIAISGDFKVITVHFGKFLYLQTLILNTSNSTLEIKANIWKLLGLRHLHTNVPAELPPPPIPTGEPSCLQTLSLITPKSCTKDVFAKACNLKKLGIRGNMETFVESSKGGWQNLEELKCLEHLIIYNDAFNSRKLYLPPSFFKFLCTLKKLTLSKTMFDWSDAHILGRLECLEVLKLKENAFKGMSWKVEQGGFNKLQVLWIEGADLKNWEASKYPFPRLRHLVLKSCENLEAVPYELADVPSFEEMKLENTRTAVNSAREMVKSIKFKLTILAP